MARRKSLVASADSGNSLETLKALRHKIADTIQNTESGRDIAALSKRLCEVMREIEAREGVQEPEDNITVLAKIRQAKAAEG